MNNQNYDSNQYHIRGHPHIVTSLSSTALHPHATNSSRSQPQFYNNPHPHTQVPQHLLPELITVNDHDVLSGRGVNIAHHSGNQRFRALITTYHDESYCTSYSASEKRAVATEIITHIQDLNPPGRFLKRLGKGQVSRGLAGPWQLLSEKEACKKTCQALRDCNRADRSGYADGVSRPPDVVVMAKQVSETGLTTKERATFAAANAATEAANAAQKAASESLKRRRPNIERHSQPHINITTSAQMESHVQVATRNLATAGSSHGMTHLHLRSPPNHVHSPPNHVPQSTSPSMSHASLVHSFPQSIIQQNMHNRHHTIAAGPPYMNQVGAVQQHQHPYHPYPPNIISQYSPTVQQPEISLSANLSPNNVMGIPDHNQHFTPSRILRRSGVSRNYSSSPIKKQRSTDDTEPSTLSGSSTTSTPMNACNASTMGYASCRISYPGPETAIKSTSCPLSPTVLAVEHEVDIGDTEHARNVGLFQINEDETDADANGSKHSWDGGAGGGAESDTDQCGGSLHSSFGFGNLE